MQFIPALHTFQDDTPAQAVWDILRELFGEVDGYTYYRHPNLGTGSGNVPDLVALARGFGAMAVRIVREDYDTLDDNSRRDPLLDLDDFKVSLQYRFNQERLLRGKIRVSSIIAFAHVSKAEYEAKFGAFTEGSVSVIWRDRLSNDLPADDAPPLTEPEWRLAKSVFQSASPLNRGVSFTRETADRIGPAIRHLERDIALLDDQQTKVAIQIPPGPQRIRGLAGTGKTVLLAMKAANIHSHFPDQKILFTFNTQSLYNQARDLITRFYRMNKQSDPDWTTLHIRHGWGGASKQGVYSDLCARQGARALTFQSAKAIDRKTPFRACCVDALKRDIRPAYDYILLDEAQDFPKEFFRVLYKLSGPDHRVYFAFDELQSLSSLEIPNSLDLFGVDDNGSPLVDLGGEYPGPMDKDLVLFKSYRCPHKVLMLAHALGLGIHSPTGCVQMISSVATWQSIGYDVIQGPLETGKEVIIRRPVEHSPNRVEDIYTGAAQLITTSVFADRGAELTTVAESIARDIRDEGVAPEHVIAISLDSQFCKSHMATLQGKLSERGIASVVPGLIDSSDEFAEAGRVTLSTVYRAKGNEAPIVYIISFDSLYDYVAEVEMRNRAFTSISRSKGWVRISGVGQKMQTAVQEIERIMGDIPDFKFKFPDKEKLKRNLDAAETNRRKREVRTAKKAARDLALLDIGALSELDPEVIANLEEKMRRLKEARGED
ncbi:MAG: ATP-binding domain-containing protein [Tepidisphaeraceae bacterium]|jgi:superfamily I DNA and RNA helicase